MNSSSILEKILRIFGLVVGVGLFAIVISVLLRQEVMVTLGFLTVIVAVSIFDYFLLSKKIREINNNILQDPQYLNSPQRRELAKTILWNMRILGPFTFIEARKLKKNLDKYK